MVPPPPKTTPSEERRKQGKPSTAAITASYLAWLRHLAGHLYRRGKGQRCQRPRSDPSSSRRYPASLGVTIDLQAASSNPTSPGDILHLQKLSSNPTSPDGISAHERLRLAGNTSTPRECNNPIPRTLAQKETRGVMCRPFLRPNPDTRWNRMARGTGTPGTGRHLPRALTHRFLIPQTSHASGRQHSSRQHDGTTRVATRCRQASHPTDQACTVENTA